IFIDVSPGQSTDIRLFHFRSASRKSERFLDGFVPNSFPLLVDFQIVIRSHRQGDTPHWHRRLRVEFGSVQKGTKGLLMIEGVNQHQALVEESLGFSAVGSDRVVAVAQTWQNPWRPARGPHCMFLRYGSGAAQQ